MGLQGKAHLAVHSMKDVPMELPPGLALPVICEREDPAYTVLHQNATFTAKPKSIKWKAAPAFAMDFRQGNFGA